MNPAPIVTPNTALAGGPVQNHMLMLTDLRHNGTFGIPSIHFHKGSMQMLVCVHYFPIFGIALPEKGICFNSPVVIYFVDALIGVQRHFLFDIRALDRQQFLSMSLIIVLNLESPHDFHVGEGDTLYCYY